MSEFTQLLSVKSMIRYFPPNGTAGFALSRERTESRSPSPPAMIIARTLRGAIGCPSSLPGLAEELRTPSPHPSPRGRGGRSSTRRDWFGHQVLVKPAHQPGPGIFLDLGVGTISPRGHERVPHAG